jgi:hypothetical protein
VKSDKYGTEDADKQPTREPFCEARAGLDTEAPALDLDKLVRHSHDSKTFRTFKRARSLQNVHVELHDNEGEPAVFSHASRAR